MALIGALWFPVLLVGASSAHAMPWTWSASRIVQSSGAGCGDTVRETVAAKPGSFDLRALTRTQAPAFDEVTGEVVARVTRVDPVRDTGAGVPGLAFTLTGSDNVCENLDAYPYGWSTEPLRLRIAYTRNEPVYFKEYQHPGNRYARKRPSSIHGGSDFGWDRIRWSSWGDRVAHGRGVYYYVDKNPGSYRTIVIPMRFRLSNPQPCYGRLRYLRMETVRSTRTPRFLPIPHRQTTTLSCENGIYGPA